MLKIARAYLAKCIPANGLPKLEAGVSYDAQIAKFQEAADAPNPMLKHDIEPIVKSVVGDDYARCGGSPDNVRKDLATTFAKEKDLWLARAAAETNWDRLETAQAVRQAIRSIAAVGIRVDETVVQPRIRRDTNSPI